jgi:aryl-alcohol dehydrogenase-like predicted oxidoreductase
MNTLRRLASQRSHTTGSDLIVQATVSLAEIGKEIMNLPKRPLGLSEASITVAGCGAWAIGGGGWAYSWGAQDDNESIVTMRHANELGINWIDTAAVYGLGRSEEVVGRLLRELSVSQRPFVFTKCGRGGTSAIRMQNRGAFSGRNRFGRNARRPCGAWAWNALICSSSTGRMRSARRLRIPEMMVRLIEIEEDKVRMAGVSNFDVSLLERCEAILHVDSLQPPFSLIHRDAAAREIPGCAQHGTGVICYSPMESGLLTDSFTAEKV